jgi:hypothetical protein
VGGVLPRSTAAAAGGAAVPWHGACGEVQRQHDGRHGHAISRTRDGNDRCRGGGATQAMARGVSRR